MTRALAALLLAVGLLLPATATTQECPFDRNGNGVVDHIEQADMNCDGVVDGGDLVLFAQQFGERVPGTETETPTSTPVPTATPSATPTPPANDCTADPSQDSEEQAFLGLINAYRAQNNLGPLALSPTLTKSASWKAADMASRSYVAHDDLNRTWVQRIRDCGYGLNAYLGENLAGGYETAQLVFDAWKASPGHDANMLGPDYTTIGIGRANSTTSVYSWYWATDFASINDSLTELLIAERGDHAAPHEITLPDPPRSYSWGMHSVEYAKTATGSLNAWTVIERDASQLGVTFNARVAIKSVRMMVLVGGVWRVGMNGTPGLSWTVSSNTATNGSYVDVGHQIEPDGSWSFAFPPNRALHFSQVSPGYVIPGTATGVAVVIEARVIGPDTSLTRWGLNAGADRKAPDGSCAAICGAAGIGRFGLLTSSYRYYTMLVTTLSDAQVRANPPF